jgi:hypothetical protein
MSPGPGAYRHDLRPNSASAPRYGFGTSNRDGFKGNEAPGRKKKIENKNIIISDNLFKIIVFLF